MPSRRAIGIGCLIGLLILPGCPGRSRDEVATAAHTPSPERNAEIRDAIMTWLDCEECVEGELDAVVAFGDVVVPTLGATLAKGPSPATRVRRERALVARHADLRALALSDRTVEVDATPDAYVSRSMSDFVARHRARSAIALAAIGSPAAARELRAAPLSELRPDVRRQVDQALADLSSR